MRVVALMIAGAIFGGLFAIAAFHAFGPAASPALGGAGFPPDISQIVSSLSLSYSEVTLRALAGAAAGGVLAPMISGARPVASLLAFVNPLLIVAYAQGENAILFFAASALIFYAICGLAMKRDHGATVGVALSLPPAALLSNSATELFPVLFLLLPFLSPWGLKLRRVAGFLVTVWAPFLMSCLSLAYLLWIRGAPILTPEPVAGESTSAFSQSGLLILAGAALFAGAVRAASVPAFAGAAVAGAILLAAARGAISF